MSTTIITVFNQEGCRRYLLPATDNADYSLVIYEKWFWLEEDLPVHLECIRGTWNLWPGASYHVYALYQDEYIPVSQAVSLRDGARFRIVTTEDESLELLVAVSGHLFTPSIRIPLASSHRVRFGTGAKSEVFIPFETGTDPVNLMLLRDWHDFSIVAREGTGYLNGRVIRQEMPLQYGDVIDLPEYSIQYLGEELAVLRGAEALEIRIKTRTASSADTDADAGGRMQERNSEPVQYFHRAPRILPVIYDEAIKIEAVPEPEEEETQSALQAVTQSVAMVIPMMLASLMMVTASRRSGYGSSIMMYTGLVMAITSGSMAAVMALVNIRRQKKRHKEKEDRRFEAYSNYLIGKTEEIREKYTHNTEAMREIWPDARTLISRRGEKTGLWNRNQEHDDFLKVRIGTGDVPFQVKIDVPEERFNILEDELRDKPRYIRDNFKTLYDVPILLDLKKHPLIGIVGGDQKKGAVELAHVICAQLAMTHCYTDVRMICFYDRDSSADLDQWDFARWQPHSFSENRKFRMVASDSEQISDICYELSNIFRKREDESADKEKEEESKAKLPHYVLFLSDPALISGELISHYVYEKAEKVGLTTVVLSDTFDHLPNECRYVLQNDPEFRGIVETMVTSQEHQAVTYDSVPTQELEDFAEAISRLRVMETGDSGEIPDSVTFFEMYGVHRLEDLRAGELWRKNKIYENIRGILGIKNGETRMYMDVHERYHGPHGLVAGTTGSGKSETLQTYLLSLAVEYSPDDIGFFIIDYKGGGMANLFDGLPHLLGSISNLSGAQVHRAMVAIKSENRRRQRMFNAAGVNNINKYTVLYKNGEVAEPIPHLFIIIDEFAELKREEPDFMKELISVAQVGRSLGVHLILSTQRPSGTVDDNIASNAKFRLCLRVQTKEDSQDMLGKPDAAYITQVGRCYLQVGNDEVYELFQSGYSGAVYNPDEADQGNATRLLTITGRDDLVAGTEKRSGSELNDRTQLDAVKDYLAEIAVKGGYQKIHRLWLPVLPTSIALNDLAEYEEHEFRDGAWEAPQEKWELAAVIGLTDDPANQAQDPLTINFNGGGHHAVIGQVVTGKSTLMQTILYALVNRYAPDYLNIYALDFSSRMLSAFEGLPHAGGVMYEGEDEKIARFFNMIGKLLDERRNAFRGGNYSQYYRANGLQYPAVVIAIDNFAAFNEKTDGRYLDDVIRISKEGESNGIFLLLSAAGFSMTEIPNRLGSNLKTCLCLEMKDKYAYSDYLHTMRFDVVPEAGVRGRGLCVVGGRVLEFQAARAMDANDDYQRMQRMLERFDELSGAWTGAVARKVPEIPENADWEGFRRLPETQEAFAKASLLPVAYQESNAEVYSLDLEKTFCYLVVGAPRAGRTDFMSIAALSAMQDPRACVYAVGDTTLPGTSDYENFTSVRNAEELYHLCNETLTPQFRERHAFKQDLEKQDLESEEIFEAMARQFAPIYILIEDLPWLVDALKDDSHGISAFLENLARRGEGHQVYLFVGLALEERARIAGYSLGDAMTSRGTGVQFGGNVGQNPYLNYSYLSFSEQNKIEKSGIGQIADPEGTEKVRRIVVPSAQKPKKKKQ